MSSLCVALFLCMSFWQVCYGKTNNPLNKFINHYEPLNYDANTKLSRGTAETGRTHNMDFTAHGRTFKLNLRPDTTTLAPGAQIVDGDGNDIEFDKDSLIMGDLVAEPGSSVHGVLHDDGTFTGKIYSKDGIFFVESAHHYFDKPTDFHSVIYKDEDVAYDLNFAKPKEAPVARNDIEEDLKSLKSRRERRDINGDNFADNTCFLSMEADYTFLKMAKEAKLAVGEILKHVQALNIIYRQTFNTSGTYAPFSIEFRVGSLRVYDKEHTPESLQPQNIDISTFLTRMIAKDYSKFCEAVYFTNRDFEGGILGLAYIGNPTGAGGMCDPRRNSKSYNTAVVTFSLQGRHSPPKVSEITFAHEVGHAFGSKHDDGSCTPGGRDGNYIMYDKATSGDRLRNDVFSSCSIRQMKANIKVKRPKTIDRNAKPKRLCLESLERMLQRGSDFCGNGVVDSKETCDCGPKEYCEVFEPKGCCNWQTCKLNSQKECSPSQGPCCDKDTCRPVDNEAVCNQGNDCLQEARCPSFVTIRNTKNYKCPSPKPRANGTECDRGTRLCYKGMCSRSICTKYELTPCECKAAKEECQACCMDENVCRPAYKITKMKREYTYNYSVGTPCGNNTGYCDFFHYCQKVNMEGPLLQLFNLYFTSEGVKELTKKYWWAILLGTIGLVAIVVLLVIFGARYTTSDNPHHPAAKPLPCLCCGKSEDITDARELTHFKEEKHGDETL